MSKNKIGISSISKYTFRIKEWWRIHKPNKNNIINQIKFDIDNFIDLYNEYRFIILFIIWIILNIIYKDSIIFNSILILSVAGLSIIVKYLNFKEDQFYLTTDFSSAIKDLDNLISECIQEYTLMNDLQNPVYINDITETKIREEVINLVIAKLSKRLIRKLTITYNPEVVHKIIAIRVYMIVMRLVVEINKDKDANEQQANQTQNTSFDLSKYMIYKEE